MNPCDFAEVWAVDFEFVAHPGESYDPVCLVAHELNSGRTARLWRTDMGDRPPYGTGPDVLFVAYSAQAELGCHLALDWPFPKNVLDLCAEFRCLTNGILVAGGKGLLGALQFYGLPGIGSMLKDVMRARILKGWPFSDGERRDILDYCTSDVDELVSLLRRMLPLIDLPRALVRGRFVRASAEMEYRGVPIDPVWAQLSDPVVWERLRASAISEIDADFGVYENGSFRLQLFEAYLARTGISWPRLASGQLDLKRNTFREMAKIHPEVAPLYELRHHVSDLREIKLAIGGDLRNRTVLWPFASKTSRSQPKASQYIFGPACWLRSLIKPSLGRAVAYVDYSAAEFGIAASLSGDERMLGVYRTGDPYLGCAKLFGMAPPEATKETHATLRDSFKVILLATQYGMGSLALAARLGTSALAARELLLLHRWHFPVYWSWSQGWIERAYTTGRMQSILGWTMALELPIKERTVLNWPIQSTGADILRVACILGSRIGIWILAPVHDAFLIEAPIDRIETEAFRMRECMRRASRIVLGDLDLRIDCKIVRYPERYSDKRGERMWRVVTALLEREHARKEA